MALSPRRRRLTCNLHRFSLLGLLCLLLLLLALLLGGLLLSHGLLLNGHLQAQGAKALVLYYS